MNKKNILCLFFVLFLLIIIYSLSFAVGEDGPNVGETPPDFTLKDINGDEVTLSSFKDVSRVVLFFGSCT